MPTVGSVSGLTMVIFLQMRLSDSSVKLSMLCPAAVRLYTFLGRSKFMFQ